MSRSQNLEEIASHLKFLQAVLQTYTELALLCEKPEITHTMLEITNQTGMMLKKDLQRTGILLQLMLEGTKPHA